MIDSGCTNHMTGDSKLLYDFMEAIQPFMSIMFGGGSNGQVLGLGKVAITNDMSLANVMLVQSLKYHLLFVRQLASFGYDTLFGLTDVKVFKRDTLKVAFVGELDGNLYIVDFSKESTFHATCLMAKVDKGWLAGDAIATPCRPWSLDKLHGMCSLSRNQPCKGCHPTLQQRPLREYLS